MSARTGIPLPKKVPRNSQARSATLIDKHSTEHNSRIFEVRNNPIVLTAFGLRESDSIIVESVVRVGGIDYFQPYLKDGIDIRLYSGRTSAVLAVAGRYRVVLSGDLGEVVCTYTIQQADLGRDVGMPSGAQANRPNLFLGDPGDGSLSNIIEVQDRPWTFFAYNLGEADAIQVLQVFGEGPNYREEVYSPESGEGALHLTVARNSITLDRSGRFRFRLQGTTPGVVLVGNPTTPQATASTSSSGGGGGTVTRVDVSAGEGLVASGSPITTVGTIQIELSDGTKASLERADTAVQSEALASVATSGDYEDLSNLPTIPEQVNLIAGDNVEITGTYPNLTIDAEGGDAGGQVDTVAAGMGIDVDSTDPTNPEVSINTAVQVSLDRADSAVQPDSLATVATSGSYDDLGDLPVIPEQINLTAGDNITLTGDYPNIEIAAQAGGGGGGQVDSVVAGTGISVDAADPENPEVALSPASIDSLNKADTAVQPESLAQVATTGEYDDLNNPPNIPERINLTAGDNITLTGDYPNIEVSAEAAGGQVDSVVGGSGIEVDNTDTTAPVVAIDASTQASLGRADTALQPGDLPNNYVTTDSDQTGLSGDKEWVGEHTFLNTNPKVVNEAGVLRIEGTYVPEGIETHHKGSHDPLYDITTQVTSLGFGLLSQATPGSAFFFAMPFNDVMQGEETHNMVVPYKSGTVAVVEDIPTTTDGLAEGTNNLYYTQERARNAAVEDSVSPLSIDVAPSGRATSEALGTKAELEGGNNLTGTQYVESIVGGLGAPNNVDVMAGPNDGPYNRQLRLTASDQVTASKGAYLVLSANDSVNVGDILIAPAAGKSTVVSGSAVTPANDGGVAVGSGARRFSEIYAVDGTINTSDARDKTTPRLLTNEEVEAATNISRLPTIFQWLHAIEEKGADARLHCGPTVQAVIDCMESCGLNPPRYGFVCYDGWEHRPAVVDEETGEELQPELLAGNRYSLRPTELAMFLVQGITHRLDAIEARLPPVDPEED